MAGLTSGPAQADVDALRGLLDLMEHFPSNDQRARYLLSSNWMRDRLDRAANEPRRETKSPIGDIPIR